MANICGDNITVTVNGGSYGAGGTVFNVEKGTLIINGGFFHVWPDIDNPTITDIPFNCIDANYKTVNGEYHRQGRNIRKPLIRQTTLRRARTQILWHRAARLFQVQPDGDIYYTVVKE